MGNLYSLTLLKQRRLPRHIAKLVSRLFELFIPSIIEEIEKRSGFMKRHSKPLPETFAKAMTLGLLDTKISQKKLLLKSVLLFKWHFLK